MSMLLRALIREILLEKRRLPVEDRIKEESIDVLDEYVDKGYFFHFTDDYKLQGLNVGGEFDTPLGIYVYPLISEFYKNGKVTVPFAGNRKYIIIYKQKSGGKFVRSSTYSIEDLKSDGHKLGFNDEQIEKASRIAKFESEPMSMLMCLLYSTIDKDGKLRSSFRKENANRATNRLRKLGYIGMFDDDGIGIIYESEPNQAFFVGSDVCEVVKIVNNPKMAKVQHELRIQDYTIKKLNNLSIERLAEEVINDPKVIKFLSNNEKIEELILYLGEDKLKYVLEQVAAISQKFIDTLNVTCPQLSTEFQLWYIPFIRKIPLLPNKKIHISNEAYQELFVSTFSKKNNITFSYFEPIDATLSNESLDVLIDYCQYSSKETIKDIVRNKQDISLLKKIPIDVFSEKVIEGMKKNSSLNDDFIKEISTYLKFLKNLSL